MKDPSARELAEATRHLADRMTELVELTRGNVRDHVLYSGLRVLPADGQISLNFTVPMASVLVQAIDTVDDIVFVAGSGADGAPTEGNGVHKCPLGGMLLVPMTGTTLTVYGTSGDQVDIAVWSKPQPAAGA